MPVPPRIRSPLTRPTPTASPGASGAAATAELDEPPPVVIGVKPLVAKPDETRSATSPRKPPMTSGVAIGLSTAPSSAPLNDPVLAPANRTSAGDWANGFVRANTCCSVAASDAELSGRLSSARARVPTGRRLVLRVASTISSMGVMPAIGSRENEPRE